MTDLGTLGSAAVVLLLGAMSPGPSLAIVLRATLVGGRLGGLACAIGHGLGFGLYALGAVFGLTLIINAHATAFTALQLLGGALLLWLAWKTMPRGSQAAIEVADGRPGFAEGFAIALLNPKIALFFVTVFSTVLQPEIALSTQLAIAALGWFIDTAWYATVAVLMSTTMALTWLSRHRRRIDGAMAAVLLALGLLTLGRLLTE